MSFGKGMIRKDPRIKGLKEISNPYSGNERYQAILIKKNSFNQRSTP